MVVFAQITGVIIYKESETFLLYYDFTVSGPQPRLFRINANVRES